MRPRIVLCVVVMLSLIVLVVAQSDYGAITGIVKDTSGAVLPGVTVEIAGPERRSVVTDAKGAFTLSNLRPGQYTLTCRLAGFNNVSQIVTVASTATRSLTLTMQVGSLAETVTVSGATPAQSHGLAKSVVGLRAAAPAAAGYDAYGPPFRHVGPLNTAAYDHVDENGFHRVATDPLSTFSIDVDTASYANVRRFLNEGSLPPSGAVRTEELVNYFRFEYPQPRDGAPFSVTT